MDGADITVLDEQLQGLLASAGECLGEDLAGGGRRHAIDRVFGHPGKAAELRETPVVHAKRLSGRREHEGPIGGGRNLPGRMPQVLRTVLLLVAVLPQGLQILVPLVILTAKEFLTCTRELHGSISLGKGAVVK